MSALPQVSRACVVREFGVPVVIEDVPMPAELEPGALLVRNRAASICGTDVHLARGELSLAVDLPVILGHEMVGEVVAAGDGADRGSVGQDLRLGDRVVWTHTTCGHCYFCTIATQPSLCEARRAYMFENIERSPYLLGGFSEYAYVLPDAGRVRVPHTVSDRLASISSCALRSVMQSFDTLGPLASTDSVVVQGVGPLGLFAVSVARLRGAQRVIAIGAPAERLSLAREYGADETIDLQTTTAAERIDKVKSLTEGRGADVVMEYAGHSSAFAEGIDLARRGGRYVTTGQLGPGQSTVTPSRIVSKNLTIRGSFSGHVKSYWTALDFCARHAGSINFEAMVTGAYRMNDINTALGRMEAMKEVKPVIDL